MDMQRVPHLLLSQHRKTADFHVNEALIGIRYVEFLLLLQALFCQTTNLFFSRTPCSWKVEQKSLRSHITREKYLKTQYSKCYMLCKTDFCTLARDHYQVLLAILKKRQKNNSTAQFCQWMNIYVLNNSHRSGSTTYVVSS